MDFTSLDTLTTFKNFKAKRISSYDKTGGNADSISVKGNEEKVIANIEGPGKIKHIWCTIFGPWGPDDDRNFDIHALRNTLIKIYWDNEQFPSIECPIGDFFGLGHGKAYTYQCAIFSTSCNEAVSGQTNPRVAMNCWLPMPFLKNAKIVIKNEQKKNISMYFYIDYEKHNSLPKDSVYLHAQFKRINPLVPVISNGKNLSDKDNYVILEAKGRGHYIGTNMSINNLGGCWWGEGDDMIFVDRDNNDSWPPDLHGTGSEDYFSHAWGMQKVSHLYCGQPWSEVDDHTNRHHDEGKVCVYRYHILDPIPFTKSIRVSIEHGHANDQGNDYSSVAYWYQDEPHKKFEPMVPVDKRISE
ncbi:MAG: DUF2961 domain-containing protein [Clostridiales bacterium]|nr:DUF2961 domain-containing protein [Clostridiales bacterium]